MRILGTTAVINPAGNDGRDRALAGFNIKALKMNEQPAVM